MRKSIRTIVSQTKQDAARRRDATLAEAPEAVAAKILEAVQIEAAEVYADSIKGFAPRP